MRQVFLDFDIFLSLLKLICDKIKENFYENIEEKKLHHFRKNSVKNGKNGAKNEKKNERINLESQ